MWGVAAKGWWSPRWESVALCRGRWRAGVAAGLALLVMCRGVTAAEHPFLIVRTTEDAALQALASRSPWREIKAAALSTSNGTTISAGAGVRDRAFALNKIMESTALAYLIDPANRDKYRDRFYTYLRYWDLAQSGNITQDMTDDTWDGCVPVGAAFFYTVVAMDIIHSDPKTTPTQAAQRDGFIAMMDRAGGPGQMGPGRFFDETPFEFHLMAHRAAQGVWALWKGDAVRLASAVADYRRSWLDFITEDGVYREYSGYGLARSGEPSRSHKHFFADVLVHTGVDPNWYAQPRLQKFYEWLGGYAIMPNRWTWPIGDSSYTSYSGSYNSNFDRSDRYSSLAGRYGQWAKNSGLGVNTLFPYLLTPRTSLPAPLEAPSRIFPDGGAWLKQPGGGREAFAAVLVNQTYTPTFGLGHIHKEQNSLHLAALGEVLLRGSGYNGWNSSDPLGGGFSFAYTNNHAVSGNVALFDYAIGNEKDPSFTNDHRKLGGLGVIGLLSGTLDYAVGDTGPGGTPTSAIPNGRHVRHTVALYPQDGVPAYALCLDELAGASNAMQAHLVWHPHSDTLSVNADGASDTEFEWKIKQTVNTTDQLHLSLFLPTAPTRQQLYNGLFGEDISGNRPYRSFVGRYAFLTYALDPATRRRNVLSVFFPRKSTQVKPIMERISTGPAPGSSGGTAGRAARFRFASGVEDVVAESDGSALHLIPDPMNGSSVARVQAKFAVYRRLPGPNGPVLGFYFVAQGRSFRETADLGARGFVSDADVTIHLRDTVGSVLSPGAFVTFHHPGRFQVRLNDAVAAPLSAGDGFVRLFVPAGTHRLSLDPIREAPILSLQPKSRFVSEGTGFQLEVDSGDGSAVYQWFRDGVALPGETGRTLHRIATAAEAGRYTVRVANEFESTLSEPATVTLDPLASRAVNLSCRTRLAAGEVLIPGFHLSGTGRKTVLIRAVGPGLAAFGVFGVLPDPRLTLYRDGTAIAANDDWTGSTLGDVFSRVGAFPLESGSKDAAVVVTLDAGVGYSVHVSGTGPGGVVLVELYDVDAPSSGGTSRLDNVSVRGRAGVGDAALIVGVVVAGVGERPVLVRAGGPALAGFGVSGTLADPRLELFDSSRRSVLANDDWGRSGAAERIDQTRLLVGAFPFAVGSKDAAAITALPPGAYTVQITPAGAGTGEVLAEIYEAP